MLNKEINVPEKTIAIVLDPLLDNIESTKSKIFNLIKKPTKKRDWFAPHFYRCLPLTIANQYGFIITNEFDFSFVWNGGNDRNSISFEFTEKIEDVNKKYFRVESHFGYGIITIIPPLTLKTPKGVNLITINPPNHIIPNVTVMTGVVESDNLNNPFTFNLKIQIPNIKVFIPAGTPLAGFIPIPRYYSDSFSLKLAEDVLNEQELVQELQTFVDTVTHREQVQPFLPNGIGKLYLNGVDVYGNKFTDHQKP
jgi:hypothetical protein